MIIFNKDKGNDVVFVQGKDVKFIEEKKLDSPPLSGLSQVVRDNTFIEFTDPEYIEFFKEQKYIPDYKVMRDLSIHQLTLIVEEKQKRIATIIKEYDSSAEKELPAFSKEIAKREYEITSIQEYIDAVKSKKQLPIPLAIDTDTMQISSHDNENNPINIGYSLDKKHILFTKTSGEPFTSKNNIPTSLLLKAIAILTEETDIITEDDYLINTSRTLSPDKKFILSEELPEKEDDYEFQELKGKIKQFFKSIPEKLTSIRKNN